MLQNGIRSKWSIWVVALPDMLVAGDVTTNHNRLWLSMVTFASLWLNIIDLGWLMSHFYIPQVLCHIVAFVKGYGSFWDSSRTMLMFLKKYIFNSYNWYMVKVGNVHITTLDNVHLYLNSSNNSFFNNKQKKMICFLFQMIWFFWIKMMSDFLD